VTKDELLAALTAERHNGLWWNARRRREEAAVIDDSDVTVARRRRQLAEDYDRAREAS
jgi:hypothetical protein